MAQQRFFPQGDDHDVLLDINTTPLIDVMLVLLIMIIITIPVQMHAVSLDMPVIARTPPPQPPQVIRIELLADGSIRYDGQQLADRVALAARLATIATRQDQTEVHVKPDKSVNYGVVAQVMATAQRLGVTKIAIVNGG